MLTFSRHWSQGYSECHHCSFPVRIQGCSLQRNSQGSQNHCQEGLRFLLLRERSWWCRWSPNSTDDRGACVCHTHEVRGRTHKMREEVASVYDTWPSTRSQTRRNSFSIETGGQGGTGSLKICVYLVLSQNSSYNLFQAYLMAPLFRLYLVASKTLSWISSQLFSQPTTATKEALLTLKLITPKIPLSTRVVKSTRSCSIERVDCFLQVTKVLGAYMLCQIMSTWVWSFSARDTFSISVQSEHFVVTYQTLPSVSLGSRIEDICYRFQEYSD